MTLPRQELADPELADLVAAVRRDPGPPARELGADELRRAQRRRVRAQPRGPELHAVTDLTIGDLPARHYAPTPDPRATIVFLHGGMWIIGDLDSHDRACRRLARATGAAVLAVDYRRAPEHPWPAAVDDTVTALRWAFATSTTPVHVMGDSSGGHLAALACLRLRDEDGPRPAGQILLYPNTDLTLAHPSVRAKGTGWLLDADALRWAVDQWVPDPALRSHPGVSPLAADLRDLPPALVVTAEHDPLRDEGNAYAARLAAAGVPTRHRCEPGQLHGFLTLDAVSPSAATAAERLFADITALIAPA